MNDFSLIQDLKGILMEISGNWKNSRKASSQEMWKNVRLGNAIIASYYTIAFGTVIAHAVNRLTLVFQLSQKTSKLGARATFAESAFFFDVQSSPLFEVIWFFQFLASIVGACAFTSFDGFFILSILHLCAQLTVLKFDMKSLISRTKKRGFVRALKIIVERHVHLRK